MSDELNERSSQRPSSNLNHTTSNRNFKNYQNAAITTRTVAQGVSAISPILDGTGFTFGGGAALVAGTATFGVIPGFADGVRRQSITSRIDTCLESLDQLLARCDSNEYLVKKFKKDASELREKLIKLREEITQASSKPFYFTTALFIIGSFLTMFNHSKWKATNQGLSVILWITCVATLLISMGYPVGRDISGFSNNPKRFSRIKKLENDLNLLLERFYRATIDQPDILNIATYISEMKDIRTRISELETQLRSLDRCPQNIFYRTA